MDGSERARIKADAAQLALPVLVERLGGAVTITEAELNDLGQRYGGLRNLAVRIEYHGSELRLTLITAPRRPPVS
jgi:hypothetical protein